MCIIHLTFQRQCETITVFFVRVMKLALSSCRRILPQDWENWRKIWSECRVQT